MSDRNLRLTVDLQQIAAIANVEKSAVSNWRRRHPGFPVPDPNGGFDLHEIERWLLENGRIEYRIPAEFSFWSLADNLWGFLEPSETTQLLVAILVYLDVSDATGETGHRPAPYAGIEPGFQWKELRRTPADDLGSALIAIATRIEKANPALAGLLAPGLLSTLRIEGSMLLALIDSMQSTCDEGKPRTELFEDVVNRSRKLDRFAAEYSTPAAVAELMVRLAGRNAQSICDPACGQGLLLLLAATRSDDHDTVPPEIFGFDVADEALRIARSRFLLRGLPTNLRWADAFRVPPRELPKSDVVLLDPPLNSRNWGDGEIYFGDRWQFGSPPAKSADLAWVQLAIQCLNEGGRAMVSTTVTSTHRQGSEADIRREMLEAGVIDAVILLPRRLRANTSSPLVLWSLQTQKQNAGSVLLVDASTLGVAARPQHLLDNDDIERIVGAVQAHRTGRSVDPEIARTVETEQLLAADVDLNPANYRPAIEIDLDEIRRSAEKLRASIPAASARATHAVSELLEQLEKSEPR